MENRKPIAISILAFLLLIICAVVFGIVSQNIQQKNLEQKAEIARSYSRVNSAFRLERHQQYYLPLDESKINEHGIYAKLYISLACYTKETGNVLTYEQAVDYLSSEYEEDGSRRTYNNGMHPEVEKYVDWGYENYDLVSEYYNKIEDVNDDYFTEKGLESPVTSRLSEEELDELVKKEADPNYIIDDTMFVTSLHL